MTPTTLQPGPDLEAFGVIAERAFAALPERFRTPCANVAILIEEFPDDEVCRDMALDSPYDLLGLYDGVDLIDRSLSSWEGPPDVILLYRSPILAYARAEGYALEEVISHVLIHEIGHHYGFSDDDMAELEDEDRMDEIGRAQFPHAKGN